MTPASSPDIASPTSSAQPADAAARDEQAPETRQIRIIRWDGAHQRATEAMDEAAEEEPLEIRVRGRAISVTMRTPGRDRELALGFLLSEGIISGPSDVLRVEHCDQNDEGNVLNVLLAPDVFVDFDRLTRHVFASSSCGLCGKATIDAVRGQFKHISTSFAVDADVITQLADRMRSAQATFTRTGGLHAAALFDERGELVTLHEDVGRHNAVDKVIGDCLHRRLLPIDRHILLVSGRTSFEILQKALAARIAIVAAVSAPSSLAVRFASDSGQTLIGFLRGHRMNIYANAQRIIFPNPVERE